MKVLFKHLTDIFKFNRMSLIQLYFLIIETNIQ
jgi:hypothetical protein